MKRARQNRIDELYVDQVEAGKLEAHRREVERLEAESRRRWEAADKAARTATEKYMALKLITCSDEEHMVKLWQRVAAEGR